MLDALRAGRRSLAGQWVLWVGLVIVGSVTAYLLRRLLFDIAFPRPGVGAPVALGVARGLITNLYSRTVELLGVLALLQVYLRGSAQTAPSEASEVFA